MLLGKILFKFIVVNGGLVRNLDFKKFPGIFSDFDLSRIYIPHVLKLLMDCMDLGMLTIITSLVKFHVLDILLSYKMKRENQISKPYI